MDRSAVDTVYRDANSRVGSHDMVSPDGPRAAYRPVVRGLNGAVSTGHLLSSMSAHDVLRRGGNAFDAGVAAGFTQCVVEHDRASIGGVAPIICFEAASGRVTTVSGLGRWPKDVSLEWFEKTHGGKFVPGMSTTITPLAMDAWLLTLKDYGTWTFEAAVAQALEYAESGFPVSEALREDIVEYVDGFAEWPANRKIFTPGNRIPEIGDVIRQPELAASLRGLVAVERAHSGRGRAAAIDAVRDEFYRGRIGRRLVEWCRKNGGILSMDDMQAAAARIEAPVSYRFGNYDVFTCSTWTQGPALLQALAILQGFDLRAAGHNSARYIHLIAESIKLAFADRDAYYGDPDFVTVPFDELLSEAYNSQRRKLVRLDRAWPELPPWGEVRGAKPYFGKTPPHKEMPTVGRNSAPDTTVGTVIDRQGNIFCSAPSDPGLRHIIDPELGFGISPRGTQSWLHPNHPSVLAPGKRPRLTTNPVLVLKDGKPYMGLCSPGGDIQPQAMLQTFLNIAVFGMNAQQATEAPRVTSFSAPGSFYPHLMEPGELAVEDRIPAAVVEQLASMGHVIRTWSGWTGNSGGVCVIVRDEASGLMHAGADPRRDAYAVAW